MVRVSMNLFIVIQKPSFIIEGLAQNELLPKFTKSSKYSYHKNSVGSIDVVRQNRSKPWKKVYKTFEKTLFL